MSESQSRYSIVERLTQRKLDIMGAKSDLKEEFIGRYKKFYNKLSSGVLKGIKPVLKQEEFTPHLVSSSSYARH